MWTPGCPVSCVSPVFRVGPRRRPAGVPRPLDVALVSPRSEARDRGKGTVVPRKRGSYGEESAPSGKVGGGSRGGGSTARPRPCLRRWWPQLSRLLSSPPAAPHSTLATPPFRDGDGAARSSFCRVGAGTPPSHLNQWGRAGLSLLGEGRAGASSFSAQRAGPPATGPTASADRGSAPPGGLWRSLTGASSVPCRPGPRRSGVPRPRGGPRVGSPAAPRA